jgi:hypothetical protein
VLHVRPELDAKTKTCLPAKTRFCHLDEQAIALVASLMRKKSQFLTYGTNYRNDVLASIG